MSRATFHKRNGVSARAVSLLRATGASSSDFVDEILDTPGIGGKYGGTDGRDALLGTLRSLVHLTGSDEAAVKWLFSSREYTAVAGNDAYLPLENGDFWSLTVMQDWLATLEKHRRTCPVLIEAIFGGSLH